jgi:dipeptide/tripeptide permease
MSDPQQDDPADATPPEPKEKDRGGQALLCMFVLTFINALAIAIFSAFAFHWWAILVFLAVLIGLMFTNYGETVLEGIIRQVIILGVILILIPLLFFQARQQAKHALEIQQQKALEREAQEQ